MVSKDVKKVILAIVIWIIALNAVNLLSQFLLFDRTSYEPIYGLKTYLFALVAPWVNFDGQNYLKIIIYGYDPQSLVFFPLFPLVVKVISTLTSINPIFVGLLIANIAAIGSGVLLFIIVKSEYSEITAYKSVLLLLLFPASFFLVAYYTESLFLFLSLITFYFLNKKSFLLASAGVLLACSTRVFGLALMAPLLTEAYKFYKEKRRVPFGVLISPIGLISYLIYSQIKFSNPFLVVKGQETARFARDIGFLSPFRVLSASLAKALAGPEQTYDSPFVYPVIILEFAAMVFGFALLVITFKKIAFKYWLYCALFVLIVAYSGGLSSDSRYLMVLFPYYIFLALKMHGFAFKLWIFSSGTLLFMLSALFLRNYWVA